MRGLSALAVSLLFGILSTVASSGQEQAVGLRHRFYVSPEEIRALDTRTLAGIIVDRIYRQCDVPGEGEAKARPVGEDAQLLMMVPQEVFGDVARRGFLNQHVTSTTRGFNKTRTRFQAEQDLAMLRLPYSRKGRELLPKYALLNVRQADFGTFALPTHYGDAAVVFKKDVLRRATWTYADSLDFSQKAGRYALWGTPNPVLARTSRYRRNKEDRNICVNYCEAQIWGELDLRDVDYVMIRDGVAVSPQVLESGVSVYRYSVPADSMTIVASGQTAQYVRGELVATGATLSPKMAAPPKSDELSLLDETELIEKFSAEKEAGSPGMISPRLRLLGELAARPKSGAVVRALGKAVRSGDEEARAMALYGLSELPPRDFKPYLLAALKDASPEVEVEAVALADDRRDDADIRAALNALAQALEEKARDPAGEVQEWLGRLDKARLCE